MAALTCTSHGITRIRTKVLPLPIESLNCSKPNRQCLLIFTWDSWFRKRWGLHLHKNFLTCEPIIWNFITKILSLSLTTLILMSELILLLGLKIFLFPRGNSWLLDFTRFSFLGELTLLHVRCSSPANISRLNIKDTTELYTRK